MTLIWTIISYVLGSLLRMRQERLEDEREKNRALYKMAGMAIKDTEDARKVQTTEAQYTRRLVMLAFTACLMFAMIYGVVHGGDMVQPITVTKSGGGFFSFIFGGGSESFIKFIQVPLSMTVALAWDLFGIMVGFYFGSGGTRR